MVEAVGTQLPKFTTIMYETKDGEKISATKKDGIVTLVGDKNGTRQMELDKFLKEELPNNVKNLQLEKSPEKDTVEISKPEEKAVDTAKETAPAQAPKDTAQAAATNPITAAPAADKKPVEENAKKLNVVA